jgi:hypothetical protein
MNQDVQGRAGHAALAIELATRQLRRSEGINPDTVREARELLMQLSRGSSGPLTSSTLQALLNTATLIEREERK